MRNLNNKSNDERYYNTIRYFFHTLKGDKRIAFLQELSDSNIALAAQCLMSGQEDKFLEEILTEKAKTFAEDVNDTDRSAKGFLALAELGDFNSILALISSFSKIGNIHQEVFNKILEEADQALFIKFLEMAVRTNKPIIFGCLVYAFNREIFVTTANKIKLEEIIKTFLEKELFGLTRLFIEKYALTSSLGQILDINLPELIDSYLHKNNIKALNLCFLIITENNLLDQYPPGLLVNRLLDLKTDKSICHALKMCIKYDIGPLERVDATLIGISNKTGKKGRALLRKLLRFGLQVYLAKMKPEDSERIKLAISSGGVDEIIGQQPSTVEYFLLRSSNVAEFIDCYFKYDSFRTQTTVEDLIRISMERFFISLRDLSHLLSRFRFVGTIRNTRDYGCYISAHSLNVRQAPFIHHTQLFASSSVKTINDMHDGDKIGFRIIGINQETFRLNVSALDLEQAN